MATLTYSMETDISSLEAPTFTTIDRGQPQAMLALDWDHPVNLVGKKVPYLLPTKYRNSGSDPLWTAFIWLADSFVDPDEAAFKLSQEY